MMISKLIASNAIGHSYKLSEKNPPPSCEETGFFEHINYLLDVQLNESKKIKHISCQISEKEKILDKINNKNGKNDSNLSSQYILEIIIKYVFATVFVCKDNLHKMALELLITFHKTLLKKKNILLSHIEKQLDGISVTDEFLENLPAHLAHSKQAEEEIRLIFSLESRLRMIIESSHEKNLYLKLYNQTINPLIAKAEKISDQQAF